VTNNPLDFELRIAGLDDVAAIADLRSLSTGVRSDSGFEQRLSEWLVGEGERRTTWLAWVGARAVGMASVFEYRRMPRPGRWDSRWGYLSNMFVSEEFRNQGVGSTLLAAIIEAAEKRAYARLLLSPSEEAVRFYQRAGFIVPDDSAGGDRILVRPTRGRLS
jgi:GNAT superfamily N-acetyltransferase